MASLVVTIIFIRSTGSVSYLLLSNSLLALFLRTSLQHSPFSLNQKKPEVVLRTSLYNLRTSMLGRGFLVTTRCSMGLDSIF